jgi:hypothetical protein
VRKPKAKYTYAWIAWVGSAVGIEAVALYRSRKFGCKDTLTAHTRCVLGIDPLRNDHTLGRVVFVAAAAWAAWHISIEPAKEPRIRETA